MKTYVVRLLIVLFAIGCARPAWAQMVQTAPGSVRGLFGGPPAQAENRTSTRWTVRFDAAGGRNTVPVDLAPSPTNETIAETAVNATVTTQYWRGRTGKFIEVNGGGSFDRQSLQPENLRSFNAGVWGQTPIGGRIETSGGFSVRYEPLLVGLPLPAVSVTETPAAPANDLSPTLGVVEEPWLSTMATGTISRGWTPRQRLEANFTSMRLEPLQGTSVGTASEGLMLIESWNMNPQVELRFGYNYSQNRQLNTRSGLDHASSIHSAEGGVQVERRLSPRRTVSFGVRGGVSYSAEFDEVTGTDADSPWVPVASVSLGVTLIRSWALSATAGREVTPLAGVTTQPFTTDQVTAQVTGNLSARLSASMSLAYSRGTGSTTDEGSFDGTSATAQLQYGISRCCALYSSYSYYEHNIREIETAPAGVPQNYGRHAVRVGMSVWLPLFGSF